MKRDPTDVLVSTPPHLFFFFFIFAYSRRRVISLLRIEIGADSSRSAQTHKHAQDEMSVEKRAGAGKLVSVGVNGDSAVINSPWCLT